MTLAISKIRGTSAPGRKHRRVFVIMLASLLLRISCFAAKPPDPEAQTSRRLESLRNSPNLLRLFLEQMPKGGDLHNHLSGAIYAESYIKFAVADGLCVDRATRTLLPPPCDPGSGKPPAAAAYSDPELYAQLINAFSMRHFDPGRESGHDHFFASFGKFFLAARAHTGEMVAEARAQAARDHVQYLELMLTPDDGAPALGAKFGWNADLPALRAQLISGGLANVLTTSRAQLDAAEAKSSETLHCGSPQAEPGCNVTVRYLYQVLRGLPPEQVFAQILTGFEMASADPLFVGLNLVQPEDSYVPMRDFNLHMKMLDFLSKIYPRVPITLHAGELTSRLVPSDGLFHVRASIEQGHARRIGHGVDVLYEPRPLELLREMARRHILVEIGLTSNDEILGVRGAQHPFPEYLRANVPVALATDDEGVSRSNLTEEFLRAVESYGLTYSQLKKIVRNSLHYSFLPGPSLWQDDGYIHATPPCATKFSAPGKISSDCSSFLKSSARAQEEFKLEEALGTFEKATAASPPSK